MWPDRAILSICGAVTVVLGLSGFAAGTVYELLENILCGKAIEIEIKDFNDLNIKS